MSDIKYPSKHSKDSKKRFLGHWIIDQRQLYKKSKLSQKWVEKLESLPGWSWDPFVDQWRTNYNELSSFVHKRAMLPLSNSRSKKEKSLAAWTITQRTSKREGTLSKKQIKKMEEISGWSWNPFTDRWGTSYNKLVSIIKRSGFPSRTSDKEISVWIGMQRRAYKKSKLSQRRIEKLESLPGWSWNPFVDQWRINYNEFSSFLRSRRFPSSVGTNKRERLLGHWVSSQRQLHKKAKLSQKRVEKLESLPGWSWNTSTDQWSTNYTKLLTFVKKNKTLPEQRSSLGKWISHQRTAYKRNKLSLERIKKLEQISRWSWDELEYQWVQNSTRLVSFLKKKKRSPSKEGTDPEEIKLGTWIQTQRRAHKKNKLKLEKIKQLEAVLGWKWSK